jgi:hypothetical protein
VVVVVDPPVNALAQLRGTEGIVDLAQRRRVRVAEGSASCAGQDRQPVMCGEGE